MWTSEATWNKIMCHITILDDIQQAIIEHRRQETPMQILESLPVCEDASVTAQLSRTLMMKGWRHTEDGLRRRPRPCKEGNLPGLGSKPPSSSKRAKC